MSATPVCDARQVRQSASWRLLWSQGRLAIDCLQKARQKEDAPDGVLPYLIHASVLLVTARNHLAYLSVLGQESFQQSPLPQRLKHLPNFEQLVALLRSVDATRDLVAHIQDLSDEALGALHIKAFRDAVTHHGVPLETEDPQAAFPLVTVHYRELAQALQQAWERLENYGRSQDLLPDQ